MNYLPGVASNCDPPDLCLLTSMNHRRLAHIALLVVGKVLATLFCAGYFEVRQS
jgi:hypothetical protein